MMPRGRKGGKFLSRRKFFIAQMGSKNETLAITFSDFKVNFVMFNNSDYVYGCLKAIIEGWADETINSVLVLMPKI